MNCGYETWLRKQTLDLRSEQRRVNLPETARGWTCSPSQRAHGTPTGSRGPGTHEARALPWQNNAHVALGVGHPAFLQHQQSGARLPAYPAERSSRDRHCKPRTRPKMQPHPLRQRPRLLRAVHSGREAPPPAAALRGVPVTLSSQSREQRRGRPAKSRGRASGVVHGELSSACPTVGWDVRAWGRSAEPRKRSVVGCAAPRTPRTAPRAPRPGLTPARTARRAEGARTGRRRPLRASALRSARGAGPHQRPNMTPSPASRGTRGHSGKEGTLRGC